MFIKDIFVLTYYTYNVVMLKSICLAGCTRIECFESHISLLNSVKITMWFHFAEFSNTFSDSSVRRGHDFASLDA